MSDRRSKRRCVTVKSQVPSAIHYVGYVEDDETPEMIMKKFEELERIKKAAQERRQQAGAAGTSVAAASGAQPAAASPDPNQHPAAPPSTSAANAGQDASTDGVGGAGSSAGPSTEPQPRSDQAPASAPAGTCADTAPASSRDVEEPNALPTPADESHHALDEEALLEVFKQTSVFNVRSALANNDLLMEGDHNPMHMRDQGGYGGGDVAYGMEDLVYGAGAGDSDLEDDELLYLKVCVGVCGMCWGRGRTELTEAC